jgi:hypothetical protein
MQRFRRLGLVNYGFNIYEIKYIKEVEKWVAVFVDQEKRRKRRNDKCKINLK